MTLDAHTDTHVGRAELHDDAQVAAAVWAKMLPSSFTGSLSCNFLAGYLTPDVMARSLALIQSETPFRGLYADVVTVLDAYDSDLLNWTDARQMIEAVLR